MKNYLRHFKQVPKFDTGGQAEYLAQLDAELDAMEEARYQAELDAFEAKGNSVNQADNFVANQELKAAQKQAAADAQAIASGKYNKTVTTPISFTKTNTGLDKATRGLGVAGSIAQTLMPQTAEEVSGVNEMMKRVKAGEFGAKSAVGGVVSAAVSGAAQVADDLFMGDKNFGAQSEAIDQAVHGVSGALMKSGNPYAMIAGAALEGANFLTKAGGQTVQGFDVDIESSGYGQMGHMASKSNRNFGAALGPLGAIFTGNYNRKMKAQLEKRNQQALMAMEAANIANDQKFEQEARMNSVQNVITNNQIALAGGLSTSALAAKRGGKLERLKNYKPSKHRNGGKLKNIELSEESSVIPEGALHAHKHNLDLDGITQKGIPVLQNIDESVETLEEIKKQGGELQQSAEIEREEIIFSKELTDYIEEARAEWHETNSNDILEEVGKRVTKELLFNTRDNAGLIEEMK